MLLSLSSAVASGLSDEESDREGGKTTFTTAFGNPAARRLAQGAAVSGLVAWAVLPALHRVGDAWIALPAVAVSAARLGRAMVAGKAAVTNAFAAQSEYKRQLHRAIWDGTAVIAAGTLVRAFWM